MELGIWGLAANLSGNVMTLWWQQEQKGAAGAVDSCPGSALCAHGALVRGRGERSVEQSPGGSMPSSTAPGLLPMVFS